jgi:hypothetical protein
MNLAEPLPVLTDREVVLLYRQWSEEVFAAGFMSLSGGETLPPLFLIWLKRELSLTPESYELELLRRWRKAEQGDIHA